MSAITPALRCTSTGAIAGLGEAEGVGLAFDWQRAAAETRKARKSEQPRLSEKLERFLQSQPETPVLAVDLDVVDAEYRELRKHFPRISIHYAVKANPEMELLDRLAKSGSCLDIASRWELEMCLALAVAPSRISYGSAIKKSGDIAYAFRLGVRCGAENFDAISTFQI